jgi:hypothetical protein
MPDPLRDLIPPRHQPLLAPPWVALVSAWLGLLMVVASLVLPFLPGSRQPRYEIEHLIPYSPADRFLPFAVYLSPLALTIGSAVLWQMRKEPRPLTAALAAQRTQAIFGIGLTLFGTAIVYIWVATHRT